MALSNIRFPKYYPEKTAVIYTDAACTTLADISLTSNGASVQGSRLTLDGQSRFPTFYGPDGVTTLYAAVPGAPSAVTVEAVQQPSSGGSGLGGVTVSGTPSTGQVLTASSSSAASWVSPAGAAAISPAASAGVVAALRRAVRSTCVALIGDSTGDDVITGSGGTDHEWFRVLADAMAARYPGWTVAIRHWNPTSTVMAYGPLEVLTTGTLNGGGERYASMEGGTLSYPGSGTAADMEVYAKVRPTDGWAPGGAAALRTIVSRYHASGSNRGWYFALDQDGKLNFTWSSTGSADAFATLSTVAVPFTGATDGWVRATLDVDNGSSGNTVTFYTSTDGVTWTQLGAPVVNTGTTSVATTWTTYYLGSINSTPINKFAGRIYWVSVRSNLPGAGTQQPQVPPLPDWWDQPTTPGNGVRWGGAPVLLFLNGSAAGQNAAYFTTNALKLNAPHGQALLFLSDGHNESGVTGYGWRSTLATYLADLRSRVFCPIVVTTQNLSAVGTGRADQETVDWSTARHQWTMAVATTVAGVFPMDLWPGLAGVSGALADDNLHPSAAGATAWGNYVLTSVFGPS